MPQAPSLRARAKSGTLLAIAFNVPNPVMTIRFFKSKSCLYKTSNYVMICHCESRFIGMWQSKNITFLQFHQIF